MFIRFDRMYERYRRTDRQTDRQTSDNGMTLKSGFEVVQGH